MCALQRVLVVFAFALLVPEIECAQQTPAIIYTGRTYGYLRWNDGRDPNSLQNAFEETFQDLLKKYPTAILVGTGDNFAPEYGARFDLDGKPLPRTRSTSETPNLGSSNSAVEFFRHEHYDALVPGQFDFFFGAEFLRQAGMILPMLGANLVIATQRKGEVSQPLCGPVQLLLPSQVSLPVQSSSSQSGGSGGKSGGGKSGGGKGSKGSSGSSQGGQSTQSCLQPSLAGRPSLTTEISLIGPSPDAVYPWTTEFEFSAGMEVKSASLCPRKQGSSDFSNNGCTVLLKDDEHSNPPPDIRNPASFVYRYDIPNDHFPIKDQGVGVATLTSTSSDAQLLPGNDIGLCVEYAAGNKRPCLALDIKRTLFVNTWVEINRGEVKYAVFGALDPSIVGLISNENNSWDAGKSHSSKIAIPDPQPALQQQLQAFRRLHGNDLTSWNIVLLAQMDPNAAKEFGATLAHNLIKIDALISAADERERTPEIETTIDTVIETPYTTLLVPPPVITPRPIIQVVTWPGGKRPMSVVNNPLELLLIDKKDALVTKKAKYKNIPENSPTVQVKKAITKVCQGQEDRTTVDVLDEFTRRKEGIAVNEKVCNVQSPFKCIALESLRVQLNADTAVLQRRDFYSGCAYKEDWNRLQLDLDSKSGPRPGLTEAIERTFWNSGFLTRVTVSGASLRAVLQASDAIAAKAASSIGTTTDVNRDLVYVGISSFNGTYYINGAVLDDSKIYSIATSDQLALGDVGYPQFAQIDLAAPEVFTNAKKTTYRLASVVAESLLGDSSVPLTQAQVIDSANPSWLGYSLPSIASVQSTDNPFQKAGSIELAAQHRNFTTVTLQQASIGYSFSKPNQSDADISQNLAGVTNPNVASPHSESLSYGDNLRIITQWTDYIDWGIDQQLTYSKNRQGSLSTAGASSGGAITTPSGTPVPTDSINLSANTLILSPFMEFQNHRYQSHFKFLVLRPGTFATNISETTQYLKTKSKTEEYQLVLKRQWNWQPSIGSRWEKDNLNYFEVGYIHQRAMNVLSGLTVNGVFTPVTAGNTPASITGSVTPNAGDSAIPSYSTYEQNGAYWLGMFTQQIPHTKIIYQGVTYGNFFAYGPSATTSTVLTRYAAEWGNSLQIPIWGNLSIAPTFNVFYFQDQSHSSGNSLIRRDFLIQLNYLFDWHQGIALGDALKGKSK